jgi:hypothetical protein
MRTRTIVAAAVVATGIFVTGAVAQHEEHHSDQATPPADKAGSAKMGMTSGNMMTQMPKIMMGQNENGKLVDGPIKSFAAIEAEKARRLPGRNSPSTVR